MGNYNDIILNFLLAYLIAMMVLAIIVIVEDLDRRLKRPNVSKASQLPVRILLLLPSVGAAVTIPPAFWHSDSSLYSDIGVGTFVVSLVALFSCVVVYRIRASKASDE